MRMKVAATQGVFPLEDKSIYSEHPQSPSHLAGAWVGWRGDLLYVLGPGGRVTHGHEHAVGQDGDHDEHAEQRGEGQGK